MHLSSTFTFYTATFIHPTVVNELQVRQRTLKGAGTGSEDEGSGESNNYKRRERERESVGEGGKEENKRGRTRERGADLHIVGDQGTHVPDEFR